jgi:hypothetical protein
MTKQRDWGIYKFLTVTCLIYFAYVAVAATANVGAVAVHSFRPDLYDRWLVVSQGLAPVVGRFVPAINYVSSEMLRAHYEDRIPFFMNIVAINWVVWAMFILPVSISAVLEARQHRSEITGYITRSLAKIGYSKPALCAISASYSIVFLLSLYIGFGYTELRPLYRQDFGVIVTLGTFCVTMFSCFSCIPIFVATASDLAGP